MELLIILQRRVIIHLIQINLTLQHFQPALINQDILLELLIQQVLHILENQKHRTFQVLITKPQHIMIMYQVLITKPQQLMYQLHMYQARITNPRMYQNRMYQRMYQNRMYQVP